MLPISKVEERDGVLTTTIPAEVVAKLGFALGDELEWAEDGAGGCRVIPLKRNAEMLRVHEEIVREYRAVFEELSKS